MLLMLFLGQILAASASSSKVAARHLMLSLAVSGMQHSQILWRDSQHSKEQSAKPPLSAEVES